MSKREQALAWCVQVHEDVAKKLDETWPNDPLLLRCEKALGWCVNEIERLRAEVARQTDMACQADWALGRVSAAIGDNRYLDPPDGGSVTLAEQVERMRADRDRLRAALDRVLPWIDARRLTPEDDAVADAVRAALAGSAPAPATTTTYTVPGPYAPIQTSGYSQPDWPTMRPVAPADDAPAIPQTSWSPGTGDEPSECLSGARSDAKSNIGPPLWDLDVVATLLRRFDRGADALDDRDCGYAGNLIRDALRFVQTTPPAGFNEKEQFVWRLGFAAGASAQPPAPPASAAPTIPEANDRADANLASADSEDAARFWWLCNDHDDRAVRYLRDSLIERMSVMSLSAVRAAIDIHLKNPSEPSHKPGTCQQCGRYLDRRGKCRLPEHNT